MLNELINAVKKYKIWTYLSFQEIKTRYVGSYLGPFWITITQIILVISIGYIYGGIFNIPPEEYMPFLTCGFVYWNLISGILNEGTRVFGSNRNYLNEIKISPLLFCLKNVCSNTIVLSFIGLFFVCINGFLAIITIGIICERFRDIPSLITNILQISFFVTPIIWDPINFKSRAVIILQLNPFWHFIEAARAPLLGREVELYTYLTIIMLTFVNFFIAYFTYKKFSNKIIYWLQ